MTALSTFAHGTKALLFYNTTESTLALQVRNGTPAKSKDSDAVLTSYVNSDADVTGLVNNPSSITTLYLDASDPTTLGVYGVIKETQTKACNCCTSCSCTTTTTETFGRLCLLSPVLVPLGTTTQKVDTAYGRLAGVQVPDTSNAGYLYYRSTSETAKISSLNIDSGVAATLSDADDPAAETFLAAYYDSANKARHVLYQKSNTSTQDKIYDFRDSDTTKLDDTGVTNAYFPAGMAAVYVDSKSQAYLYYVSKHGSSYHLWRAVKAGSDWGTATKVDTDSDLNQTTQVTATVITGTKKNYVAYVTDESAIETVQDDWLKEAL